MIIIIHRNFFHPPTPVDIIVVGPSDNLQTAINSASNGAILTLDPTGIYTGNFVINKPLTIVSAGTIPDRRLIADDIGDLPVIRSNNNTEALYVTGDDVTIRGIHFDYATSGDTGTHIILGDIEETTLADVPDNITIEKCLFIGNPAGGTKRSIVVNASNVTIVDTSILDIKCDQADVSETQAVWVMNTPGPVTIRNSRLQASGENFLSGGDTMRLNDINTTGITIEDCLLDKPLSWQGDVWNVKNVLEIKQGIDVMIDRCVLDGCWSDAQDGYALMITPKNQYGDCNWTKVANVTFQNSIIRNCAGGFNLAGDDLEEGHLAERTDGVYIKNNLIILDNVTYGEPGAGKVWLLTQGPANVHIIHNTCLNNGNSITDYDDGAGDRDTIVGLHKINYNIFQHNSTGFRSNESNNCIVNLDRFCPDGYEFISNVVSGGPSNNYPATTIRPTTVNFATFVDTTTGELLPDSPYIGVGDGGSDLGCDFELLTTE